MPSLVDDTPAATIPVYDGLYDLACHLTGDKHQAEELLCLAVQSWGGDAVGDDGRGEDPRGRVVRTYLCQNHSSSHCPGWLTSRLRIRGKGSAVKPPGDQVRLASLSHQERACLILRERLGLPVGEIARLTGLGPARTSQALFSARERLRASSTRQGE